MLVLPCPALHCPSRGYNPVISPAAVTETLAPQSCLCPGASCRASGGQVGGVVLLLLLLSGTPAAGALTDSIDAQPWVSVRQRP